MKKVVIIASLFVEIFFAILAVILSSAEVDCDIITGTSYSPKMVIQF